MCNIWRQKFDYQISPDELRGVVANPLFSEVKAIGINGGEPTLRKDLADVVDVLFKSLPKLSSISLITNSLISSQVIDSITKVGKVIQSHSGELDVMVSLDGIGDIHDKVRGRKDNFVNALEVIDFISQSSLVTSCRLGCTVIRENIYGLHDLLEFALSKGIYIKYRLGIPHQRLYSRDVTDPFALTFEEKYHFSIFLENLIEHYEASETQKFFYKSLIQQLMYHKPRVAGCDWQHRGATLSARGELLYCAVESKTLGSAIAEDAEKLYFGNQDHLAEIVKTKCQSCTHDYVGLPPTKVLVRNYTRRFQEKLGFSKSVIRSFQFLEPLKHLKQRAEFHIRLRQLGVKRFSSQRVKPANRFSRKQAGLRKIMVCGWYGTETLGDKAILGGVVSAIKSALEDTQFYIVSLEPYISQMTILQMPELYGFNICTTTEAVELSKSMDLVVFGGGPLMAISPLADMLAIFDRAVKSSVPTLVAGCGVGPLGASYYTEAIRDLLNNASCRIYRDQKSKQIAQAIGVDTAYDEVAEDPAFTWLQNYVTPPAYDQASVQQISEQGPRLLLGLRNWPYKQYARELPLVQAETLKTRFEGEVVSALELLVEQFPGLKIIPFPMCTNHIGGDDRWFYRRLFRNHHRLYTALDLSTLDKELTPEESVTVFRSANAALTMRFHSLVFALACGIPAVAIDYTLDRGKVAALAQAKQVPYLSLTSITAEFIVSSLSSLFSSFSLNLSSAGERMNTLSFKETVASFISSLDA